MIVVCWVEYIQDVLSIYKEGEVIFLGIILFGFIGFENLDGMVVLVFGFLYKEVLKIYICKFIFVFLVIVF